MPMASPPLDVGGPGVLTFRMCTFWMMMFRDSRMWMPIWSNRAPLPTPTIVTLLIFLSSILSLAVSHPGPDTLEVLPWLMVPSTWMMIGVLVLGRWHRAWWISVP